jgi:hypothetical protein
MTYLSERQIKQLLDDYLAKADIKSQAVVTKTVSQFQIAKKRQGNNMNSILVPSSL